MNMPFDLKMPDFAAVFTGETECLISAPGGSAEKDDVRLEVLEKDSALSVRLTAGKTAVSFIRLRWNIQLPKDALFMGDAFERAYGDLQWKTADSARLMYWYFLMTDPAQQQTSGFGVKVRPNAFAIWSCDSKGITLFLDVRCGAKGVLLNGRTLEAAAIVSKTYQNQNTFSAAQNFCREMMIGKPLPLKFPVYGGNNWYYAYGRSSHEEILADSRYISSLAGTEENRPFMVIDDGWQQFDHKPGAGPWRKGNERFPDMGKLASEMRACGVRPGIWFRPLSSLDPAIPGSWLLPEHKNSKERSLDCSIPEVLDLVKEDIRRLTDWGYELIKHDFSTWDSLDQWGWETKTFFARGDWSFADRSKTSAEIILQLYKTILDAAGDAIIIGCNTMGHMGAGLMHLSRIGEDTSGITWERSRQMGINSLAFRLFQHKIFFDVDADCVGFTGSIPWELNKQWTELLAKSGTPLFAAIKPQILSDAEFSQMQKLFSIAARQEIQAEPLDWLNNTIPDQWLFDGNKQTFDWYANEGNTSAFLQY